MGEFPAEAELGTGSAGAVGTFSFGFKPLCSQCLAPPDSAQAPAKGGCRRLRAQLALPALALVPALTAPRGTPGVLCHLAVHAVWAPRVLPSPSSGRGSHRRPLRKQCRLVQTTRRVTVERTNEGMNEERGNGSFVARPGSCDSLRRNSSKSDVSSFLLHSFSTILY